MTTRDVLLKWMRGAEVPGIPTNVRPKERARGGPAPHGGFDHGRMRAQLSGEVTGYTSHARSRYTVLVPKDASAGMLNDAIIGFGKHESKRLSEIAEEDPSYLNWLVNKAEREDGGGIDDDLCDIARAWLEAMPSRARKKRAPKRTRGSR